MKITRENYEAFFLDFHEGNLGEAEKQELLLFLRENPDLKAGFDAFEIIEVSAPAQSFAGKEFLKKKEITTENYTDYFVAYAEGDLSSSERKEVEQFAATSPSLRKELELFGKLKITPDPKIVFKNKKTLRRQARVIQLNKAFYRYAAAAVLALLVITYFYSGNENKAVLSQKETGQPSSDPKHAAKQTIPNEHATVAPVVASKGERKKEEVPSDQKQPLPAQHRNRQAIQPSTSLTANNTEKPGVSQQKESPVISPATSRSGDNDASLASTAGKEKEPETFKPALSDLKDVFSQDELNELGLAAQADQPKKPGLWDLASKGAAGLGKLTGTPIAMTKSNDELEDTKTVALNVGKFSVSHTSGR